MAIDKVLSHTMARAKSLALRLRWLAPVAGGVLPALRLAARIRNDKHVAHTVRYRNASFRFRGIDERALKEVLFDREYDFAAASLRNIQRPVIADIGAHIGTFGLWALSVNDTARVISIEADPETFAVLDFNRSSYAQQIAEWTILHFAASDRTGERVAFSTAGASMSHRVSLEGEVEVSTIALADVLLRAGPEQKIDLMKLDIEGAEERFLCAEPEQLSRIAMMIAELHPDVCDAARVRRTLERHYARVVDVTNRSSKKPLLFCTQPRR